MNTNRPISRSQSGKNHRDECAETGPTREGVLHQIAVSILLAMILLGLPTLVVNILNDFKLSAPDSLGASLSLLFKPGTVAYLVAIGLFVFRKKLPLWVVSTMMVAMLMLVGFNSLIDLGFIGSGMLYFMIACALGALFFDGWRAFVPAIVSIAAIALGGWLWVSGVRTFYFDPAEYAISLNTYVVRMVTIFFFLAIVVGSIRRMNGFLTDALRAQTQLNTDMHKGEEFRKRVFESSIIPIIIMDADSLEYLDCNQAAVDIYQFKSREETLGKTPLDVSAPLQYDGTPSSEKFLYYINLVLEKGSIVFEWRHQRPSGEIWDAEVHLLSFSTGTKSLLQFSLLDITERKRAEDAQRTAEARYRALVEQIPAITYIDQADGSGRSSFVSPQIQSMLDVSPEDWRQADAAEWGRMIHPEDSPRVLAAYRRMVESGQPFNEEYRIFRPDGSLVWVDDHAVLLDDARGQSSAIHGVMFDITERKQAEERIALQAQMVNIAPGGIIIHDFAGRILYANPRAADMHGCSAEEFMALNIREIDAPESADLISPRMSELMEKGEASFEVRHRRKDGSTYPGQVHAKKIEWASKPAILSITIDIAERKRTEEALRASEERYRSLFTRSLDGIYRSTHAGKFVEINPGMVRMFGYSSREEMLAVDIQKELYFDPTERGSHILDTGKQGTEIYRMRRKDGTEIWVEDHGYYVHDEQGNIIFHEGILRDVTERKRAEEELDRQTALFRSLFEGSPEAIAIVDPEDRILNVNRSFETLFGYLESEAQGHYVNELLVTEPYLEEAEAINQMSLGKRQVVERETVRRTKDGRMVNVSLIGYPVSLLQRPIGGFAIYRDITERKQAEEKLLQSEERLRLAVSAGQMGTWDRNFLTGRLDWSVECKAMFGLSPEVEMNDERFVQVLHPEDRLSTDQAIRKSLEKQTDFVTEYRVIWPDGTVHWIAAQGRGYYNDAGQAIRMTGITFDITERKRAEDEIKRNANFTNTLLEAIPTPVFYKDREGRYQGCNRAFTEVMGVTSDEIRGKTVHELWPSEYADVYHRKDMELMQSPQHQTYEFQVKDKNGTVRPVIYAKDVFHDEHGQVAGVVGAFIDITDRKRAEKILTESEEKYRNVIEKSYDGILLLNEQGIVVEWNRAMELLTGLTKAEAVGQTAWNIMYRFSTGADGTPDPVRLQPLKESMEQYFKTGRASWLGKTHEIKIHRSDGTVLTVLESNFPIETPRGFMRGSIFRDITERKRAEEALKESEAIFSSFLEHSPVYVFFKDKDIRSLMLSKNYEQMLGMPISNLLGKTMDELFPSDLAKSMVADDQRILNEGKRVTVVEELNGRIYETTKFPVFKDGEPHVLAGFTLDITERKQAEEELCWQNQYLLALQETALELVSQLDLETLLENIVKRAGQIMETTSGYLDLVDSKTGQLVPRIGFGVLEESLNLPPVQPGEGIAGTVWQTREPLVVNDYDNWPGRVGSYPYGILAAVVGVPLISGDKVLGVLGVGHGFGPRRTFEPESVEILTQFSRLATVAIENARLFTSAQQEIAERKQVEENLRNSQQLLQAVMDNIPQCIFWKDNQLTYLGCNRAFAANVGLASPNDIVGKTDWDLPSKHAEIYRADDNFVMKSGIPKLNYEEPQTTPDGATSWLRTSKIPMRNVDGNVYAVLGLYEDITERKQADERLRQSEEQYRYLFENNPHPMWAYDLETLKFLEVNDAAVHKYGYSRIEFLSMTIADIRPPEELERLQNNLARPRAVIEHSGGWKHKLKDGTIIDVAISSHTLELTGHMAALVVAQDITERKRTETALRTAEEKYRNIFENAMEAITQTTPEGRYITANPATARILGYDSPEEMISSVTDISHQFYVDPSRREQFKELMDRYGSVSNFESEVYRKDGSRIWMLENSRTVWDEYGNLLYYEGTAQEITERKRAEEALKESRALFHSLVESMPQNVFSKDLDGRFVFANQRYCATEGKPLEAIIGKTDFELHPPDLARQYWADDRLVIETEQMIDKVEVHQPLGGKPSYVQVTKAPIYNAEGQVKGMLGLFWDVTDRKRAEDALRESEELFRKMNENSPLGMHFYRLDGDELIFTGANPAADKLLGVDNSQFIGKTIEEAFPPLVQTEVPQRYRDAAAISIPWSTEQIVYDDGKVSGAFEVKAFQTKPGSMVAIFADITVRKQAEEEIRKLNAGLEQRVQERTAQLETMNKELESFSYSVSHDLRAPLRGIDGWSQALLEDYYDQLDEQAKKYIERVRSETQRMGHLIDDILQLSRLTRSEMVREQVDLSSLAQSIAGRLQQDDPQRRIDFEVQGGVTAMGDPRLLEVVLVNLLGNAFKFSGKRTDARIEFGQTELQGERVFFVRDNGAGFDMAYSQKLFGAFQRMHKASEFPGTGVGLATVQRIIHRHGGRVWAEAEVDHGATFYFTLG